MVKKISTGNSDIDRIDISQPSELRDWAEKFDVTTVKIKAAVNTVGTSAKKVEAYLKKR